jgi:hypothetical protein
MYKFTSKESWQGFVPQGSTAQLPIKIFKHIPNNIPSILLPAAIQPSFITAITVGAFWKSKLTQIARDWWSSFILDQSIGGIQSFNFTMNLFIPNIPTQVLDISNQSEQLRIRVNIVIYLFLKV